MLKSSRNRWTLMGNILLSVASVMAILPFLLLVIVSVTDSQEVLQNGYSYFPNKFSLEAYQYIFSEGKTLLRYFLNSFFVTAVGTTVSLFITCTFAYALSKKNLPGRGGLLMVVIISMLFNAGLVPTYIVYTRYLHINNTYLAYIVPNLLMNTFFLMIVKNYFEGSIPGEIYDAAEVDGAGFFCVFWRVCLPLSKPILATVGLLQGIAYWNDWQNGLYYIRDDSMLTAQTYLHKVNEGISFLAANATSGINITDIPTNTLRMAIAVIAILPVTIVYLVFHQYFEKGLSMGAVKG